MSPPRRRFLTLGLFSQPLVTLRTSFLPHILLPPFPQALLSPVLASLFTAATSLQEQHSACLSHIQGDAGQSLVPTFSPDEGFVVLISTLDIDCKHGPAQLSVYIK